MYGVHCTPYISTTTWLYNVIISLHIEIIETSPIWLLRNNLSLAYEMLLILCMYRVPCTVYIYIYGCVYVSTCVRVSLSVYIYICVSALIYVCVCVYECVCIYACMCMSVNACVCV